MGKNTLLSDLCVYTIKHSQDIEGAILSGLGTFTEKRVWREAERLIEASEQEGRRVPIIFAAAEETERLIAWGFLDSLKLGDGTTQYSFSGLKRFIEPAPFKTQLIVNSTGEYLSDGFIRPYAICKTPDFLLTNATSSRERRYWTAYWRIETANQEIGTFFDHTGFSVDDEVSTGDIVYAISNSNGVLHILGRMEVKEVISEDVRRVREILGYDPWGSDRHAIAEEGSGTRISWDHPVDSEITSRLIFKRADGNRPPKLSQDGDLDKQTLRGVSELTPESAKLLDEIIKEEIQESDIGQIDLDADNFNEEDHLELSSATGKEGIPKTFLGKRYERSRALRTKAVEYHGVICAICGFSFGEMYGEHGKGFVEVHHIIPLALCDGETGVNYITDMVPLCANCHRMIHRNPLNPLSVDSLREIVDLYYEKLGDGV
jgi:hypothetical protein